MRIAKGSALAGIAAALFALLLAPVLTGAGVAHAQNPPATFYGGGLTSGDMVSAMIGDASCGTAEADASGSWSLSVAEGTCGAANGMMVSFMINDAMANETATWMAGGVPDDVAAGITLTPAAMTEDGDGDGAMDGGDGDAMVPAPGNPGNAGLASGGGSGAASWLAAGLGLLALAGAAGARIATARRTG